MVWASRQRFAGRVKNTSLVEDGGSRRSTETAGYADVAAPDGQGRSHCAWVPIDLLRLVCRADELPVRSPRDGAGTHRQRQSGSRLPARRPVPEAARAGCAEPERKVPVAAAADASVACCIRSPPISARRSVCRRAGSLSRPQVPLAAEFWRFPSLGLSASFLACCPSRGDCAMRTSTWNVFLLNIDCGRATSCR